MELISKLSDMIEEELNDAEKYIKYAFNYKEERKELADTFYTLSTEEIKHVNMLHTQVVTIIEEYKKTHGDPPEKMQGIYDYLHKKHIRKAADIKAMQTVYKG